MMRSDQIADQDSAAPRDAVRLAFKTEISEAISGIVDRDHFLQRLARRVADVTGHGWVAIYTRSSAGGDLLLRSSTIPKSRPIPARVGADAGAAHREVSAYSGAVRSGDQVISVPIGSGDDTMGALVLYSAAGTCFGHADQAILAGIAEEIAPAIAVAEHHHVVKQASVIDLTTGAYVGWYVNQRFEEEIARAHRSEAAITIVLVAILDFESIQRDYGYSVVDSILRDLATEYSGLTRVFDVVGVRSRSEFSILLPDTDLGQAATVIARIHQRSGRAIERLDLPSGLTPIRVVTGAAAYPADGDQPTAIFVTAEHRLNQNEVLHRRMAERG